MTRYLRKRMERVLGDEFDKYHWHCIDANGDWFAYKCRPTISCGAWWPYPGDDSSSVYIGHRYLKGQDWQHTLERI